MSEEYDFSGIAYVDINGERIEVENIDIETDLSEKEVFGVRSKECDACGHSVRPLNMIIVSGTDGEKSGTYHKDCKPE